ncbi:MAG: hypothetical protein ACYS7Y_30110 [Planctomycetota bacterium]|jgi:hypothetical protein
MTRADGFFLIMALVMVGGAIRILIDNTRLGDWVREKLNQPRKK